MKIRNCIRILIKCWDDEIKGVCDLVCEYCENKEEMGNKPIEDKYAINLQIDGNFLYSWCVCGRKVVREISFCPMCGEKLGE